MRVSSCFGPTSSRGDLYPVPTPARLAAQPSPLVSKVKGLFEQLKYSRPTDPKPPLNFTSPQLGERLLEVLHQKKPVLQVLRRVFGQGGASTEQVKTDAARWVAKAIGILLANRSPITPEAIQSVLSEVRGSGSHPSFNAPSWSRYVNKAIAEVQKSVPAQVSQFGLPASVIANEEPFFTFKSAEGHTVCIPSTAAVLFKDLSRPSIKGLVKKLEKKIDREIQAMKNSHVLPGDDWGLYIEKNQIALRLSVSFCADPSLELLGQVPEFVAQLVKAKLEDPKHYKVWYQPEHGELVELDPRPEFKNQGAEWRTKELPQLFKDLELAVAQNVAKTQKREFFKSTQPEAPNKALIKQLNEGPLGERYPEIVEPMVRSVLKKQTLAFLPSNDPRPGGANKFRGGYLKKGSLEGITYTRVKAASGQVYALLNTLTPAAAQALKHQHGLEKQDNPKVVLGQGGFGKVRLARNMDTGQIVAVKKFLPDEQKPADQQKGKVPDVEANLELQQLDLIKNQLQGRENTNLASYLDYAHVTLPHVQGEGGKVVGKSYIFMDLANAGDGKQAITQMRSSTEQLGRSQAALSLCIKIAKHYAVALRDLHQLGFAHRDVKPANFLHAKTPNTEQENIRLADFGFLSQKQDDKTYSGGTLSYFPPEAKRIKQLKERRKVLMARGASNADTQAIDAQLAEATTHYSAAAHDAFSLGKTLSELRQAALKLTPQELSLNDSELNKLSAENGAPLMGLGMLNFVISSLKKPDPNQRMSVNRAANLLERISV